MWKAPEAVVCAFLDAVAEAWIERVLCSATGQQTLKAVRADVRNLASGHIYLFMRPPTDAWRGAVLWAVTATCLVESA